MNKKIIKNNIVRKMPKMIINFAKVFLAPTRTECMRRSQYYEDGLLTLHVPNFREEYKFQKAKALTKDLLNAKESDYPMDWRLHTALWVAKICSKLEGDFVECGVDVGYLSRTIAEYINFNKLDKKFYLLDTWNGLPLEQATKRELKISAHTNEETNKEYKGSYDKIRNTFRSINNVKFIKGKIPDTLKLVKSDKIAYLSLDMNIAYPEIKALEFFWDKIVEGGMVLLDDYCFNICFIEQREAIDKWAKENNTQVLSMATGQGLIIKGKKK